MVEALSIFFALYRGVYKQKCNSCTFLRCSLHLISGPFHPYPFSAAPKPCCVVPRSQTQNPCCVMQYFLLNSEPIANLFLYTNSSVENQIKFVDASVFIAVLAGIHGPLSLPLVFLSSHTSFHTAMMTKPTNTSEKQKLQGIQIPTQSGTTIFRSDL